MTNAAVRREYARLAPNYDRRWGKYVTISTQTALKHLTTLHPMGSLLDMSCGTGVLLHTLNVAQPGLTLVGMDLSLEMLVQAQHKLGTFASLVQASANRLPFADAVFDAVTCVSALHYFSRPRQVLEKIRRTLKPGGQFILTDWCADYLTSRLIAGMLRMTCRPVAQVFGTDDYKRLVAETGFRLTSLEYYRIGVAWGMMTAVAVRD